VKDRHDVLIIGGGITGLSAAYYLTTLSPRPLRLALLEASTRLGGTIGTEREAGFLIDPGPDCFVALKPQGRQICEAVGLGGELIRPEESAKRVLVRSRGKLKSMPEGMILGLPTSIPSFLKSDFVSWGAKLRMGLDLVLPRGDGREESIAGFVRRRFGREAVDVIGEPLLAGIHSGRAAELSMNANFPQMVELERKYRSIIRGLRARARAGGERGTPFLSLQGGMGHLVTALAARVPQEAVRLGCRAARVDREPEGYSVTLQGGDRLSAPILLLAIRSHEAAALIEREAPDLAAALGDITYASSAVAFFGYERTQIEHPLDAFGFVSRPGEGRVLAATFVSSKFAGRAPEGKVLLRAFVGGAHDEVILAASDAEILETAQTELGRALGIRGPPLLRRLYRYDRGTPQLKLGHAERVARLRALAAEETGLFIAGGGYEGVGIPECVRQARSVAERGLEVSLSPRPE
jgi:oxygen-dependent protoporphyrinogen oxidase